MGREAELQTLVEGLSMPYARSSSCVIVTGVEGVGKTRLIQEFVDYLQGKQRPAIVVELTRADMMQSELGLVKLAASRTVSLKPELQRLVDAFKAAADRQEREGSDLAGTLIDLFEARSSSGWSPLTRCLFILEDFASWPEFKLREWRSAVRMLRSDESDIIQHLDFVLTGRDPDDTGNAWMDYGVGDLQPTTLLLPPLGAQATQDILTAMGVPRTRHPMLQAQAEGNPGQLIILGEEELAARAHASQQGFAASLFDLFPKGQHPLLHGTCALNQCCRDGLEILLKRKVTQEEWKEFIKQYQEVQKLPGFPGWTEAFRQQVCDYAEQEIKRPRWPDHLLREINDLCEILPDEMIRRQIVYFAPFFYFTKDLLKNVYHSVQAAALEAIMKARPEAFLEVDGLYQLSPELQRPVLAYAELTGFDRDGHFRAQVQEIWRQRQSTLQQQASDQAKEYEELQQRLRQCDQELDRQTKSYDSLVEAEQRQVETIRTTRVVETPRTSRVHRTLGGLAAELLGIFFLYNGIIFTKDFNVVYCTIGLGLVMAGIMGSLKSSPQPVFAPSSAPATREPVREAGGRGSPSHVRRLREYQLKTLKERKRSLSQRLQRIKRDQQEIEKQLELAYVY
ncbi:MAG: hypothetical protein E1N59_138 [Puniceicoccaceae bacterium 5H]|nr:MAG: hypothetical protein E1N59_138 [Puniceicoccaceae bacterium 5H]